MKRTFQLLCVLFSAVLLTTACLGSDDDTATYYDDVALTSFTLGTLNKYLHATSSKGEDSIYKVTVSGSIYKMTIDQLKHEIYNRDSLPYGTDLKHVMCSLATRHNGMVFLESLVSDTLWLYQSADSLDFSEERKLVVFSSDGQHKREYKVKLNVKQTSAERLAWTETDPSLSPFPLTAVSDEFWGDKEEENASRWPVLENYGMDSWPYKYLLNTTYTLLLGNDAGGHVVVWHRLTNADGENSPWVFMADSDTDGQLPPEGVTYSLVSYNGLALAFGSNGLVYQSRDWGLTWTESSAYNQPDGVNGRVEVTVDDSGVFWLYSVETGQVWRSEK